MSWWGNTSEDQPSRQPRMRGPVRHDWRSIAADLVKPPRAVGGCRIPPEFRSESGPPTTPYARWLVACRERFGDIEFEGSMPEGWSFEEWASRASV